MWLIASFYFFLLIHCHCAFSHHRVYSIKNLSEQSPFLIGEVLFNIIPHSSWIIDQCRKVFCWVLKYDISYLYYCLERCIYTQVCTVKVLFKMDDSHLYIYMFIKINYLHENLFKICSFTIFSHISKASLSWALQ